MIFSFESFELDEACFELRKSGRVIPLQPRAFEALVHLVRNRSRVVGKAELVAGPWRGAKVSSTAIHQAILLARRALDDDCTHPRFVRTVRGRGFRFVGEVSEIEPGQPSRVNLAASCEESTEANACSRPEH